MSDPDDEKAAPQIQPDRPPRDDGPSRDDEPEVEDPELRSGHIGTDDTAPRDR